MLPVAGSLAFAVFPLFPAAPGKTFETFHGTGRTSVGLQIINSPCTTIRIFAYFTIDEEEGKRRNVWRKKDKHDFRSLDVNNPRDYSSRLEDISSNTTYLHV